MFSIIELTSIYGLVDNNLITVDVQIKPYFSRMKSNFLYVISGG